ncbi:SUKH-3 domain-containing protein [Kitasatospora sp. NPDC004614]|uniref:SUKH-3 domain-containing protein n=1 Tax=unclassified Kitasatospora TaxID=2633591 RepID=UPI0036A50466
MNRWSDEVTRVLTASGWTPGRAVETGRWRELFEPGGVELHAAAEAFLREFGGLTVDIDGPGITCARTPFELDPELAVGEEDRYLELGEDVGRRIFPLGELDHGRFFLGIDETGEVYLVEGALASFGPMPQAMEHLILGVMPRWIRDEPPVDGG